jgi:hypothetical protein
MILLASVAFTGCSNQAAAELAVQRPWARPVSAGAALAVMYFEVTSDVPDTLTAVEVSSALAEEVQLHVSMGEPSNDAGHIHGAPGGPSVGDDPFAVSPDRPLVLEPGGVHAMLVRVKRDLIVGESFTATFVLASGRRITADVIVATNPPN